MTDQDQSAELVSDLIEIVGATHVSSAPADVEAYGGLEPQLVVWPGAASEVARVLKTCTERGVAAGVSAGGTRATGHWPVPDNRPRLALDTRRMMNILEVDELSLTVHSQCGIQLQHLEQALNQHSLTLGPYPTMLQRHTLGGLLAAPHPAAHSPRTGWLTDACMGVSVAHSDGTVIHTRVAPRRATGPDIARLYLGSRGALGVITTAVLKVHRQPEQRVVVAYALPGLAQAVEAAHVCMVEGIRPARLRALDAEQAIQELGEMQPPLPAVLLAALAGPDALVAAEQKLLDQVLTEAGGTALSQAVGNRWWARQSAVPDAPEPLAVGTRIAHADVKLSLAAVPRTVQRRRVRLRAEEFTLQGVTLWVSLGGTSTESGPALRSALLDAGLDPFRLNFPPLLAELRRQLDPSETLVVMEA
jgi:alkyldihydroxyacetonephosphate synthase